MDKESPLKTSAATVSLQPEVETTRRLLLKGLFGILGGLGIGSIFYGLYRFLAPGAGEKAAVEVSLEDIPEGGVYYFQYGGAPGILLREENGNFKAFSLVCTHLACKVVWNSAKKEFYCPCHDGFFDAEGKVLSGPPPSPLERWKVELKGKKVIVGEG